MLIVLNGVLAILSNASSWLSLSQILMPRTMKIDSTLGSEYAVVMITYHRMKSQYRDVNR